MTKSIMLALAAAGAMLCSASANAGGHVSWSIGINAPPVGAVVSGGPAYGYPAYGYPVYESYPVYAPAPVYVEPAPVYYRPARSTTARRPTTATIGMPTARWLSRRIRGHRTRVTGADVRS